MAHALPLDPVMAAEFFASLRGWRRIKDKGPHLAAWQSGWTTDIFGIRHQFAIVTIDQS